MLILLLSQGIDKEGEGSIDLVAVRHFRGGGVFGNLDYLFWFLFPFTCKSLK